MSRFVFNGVSHTISLLGDNENEIGRWTAYNNIAVHDDHGGLISLRYLRNGIYNIIDRDRPHAHNSSDDSINGGYGSYGIIRFNYPGHSGIGVHSGRANRGGATFVTYGCIRTTEEAMRLITNNIRISPLTTIDIRHNEPGDHDDPAEVGIYQPVRTYLI